jgi:predicted RNA methylase
MTIDRFYTPDWLAGRMAARAQSPSIQSVADFAVGDGSLLRVADDKWPSAIKIGADIDPASIARLRRTRPGWLVSQCDFLSERSRNMAWSLRGWMGKVDLVMFNPPFSCRGAQRLAVAIDDRVVRCSRARLSRHCATISQRSWRVGCSDARQHTVERKRLDGVGGSPRTVRCYARRGLKPSRLFRVFCALRDNATVPPASQQAAADAAHTEPVAFPRAGDQAGSRDCPNALHGARFSNPCPFHGFVVERCHLKRACGSAGAALRRRPGCAFTAGRLSVKAEDMCLSSPKAHRALRLRYWGSVCIKC